MDRVQFVAKLMLPQVRAAQYILGMDYGFHQDPTEIGVAYRDNCESNVWKMLAHIHVTGADPLAQARLLYFIGGFIGRERIGRVGMDLQHAGIAVALCLSEIPSRCQWPHFANGSLSFRSGYHMRPDWHW